MPFFTLENLDLYQTIISHLKLSPVSIVEMSQYSAAFEAGTISIIRVGAYNTNLSISSLVV